MNIYLARHGTTDWNKDSKIQGLHSSHLTAKGIDDARRLKTFIGSQNISFDRVICSPSDRTLETLQILYPDYQKHKEVFIDPRLAEREHTNLIGKTKKNIEHLLGTKITDRLSWELYFEGTRNSLLTDKFPGDESLLAVATRVKSLVEEIRSYIGETVFLIGHSIINQCILEYFLRKTFGQTRVGGFQKNDEIRILHVGQGLHDTTWNTEKY